MNRAMNHTMNRATNHFMKSDERPRLALLYPGRHPPRRQHHPAAGRVAGTAGTRLAGGARVLKQHRGHSGIGVWRIEQFNTGPCQGRFGLRHAQFGSAQELVDFAAIAERRCGTPASCSAIALQAGRSTTCCVRSMSAACRRFRPRPWRAWWRRRWNGCGPACTGRPRQCRAESTHAHPLQFSMHPAHQMVGQHGVQQYLGRRQLAGPLAHPLRPVRGRPTCKPGGAR